MRGVPIADIIDIDEAVFFLENSDQKFGKKISSMGCSQNGVYGHGEKVNLPLAICEDNVGGIPNALPRTMDGWKMICHGLQHCACFNAILCP